MVIKNLYSLEDLQGHARKKFSRAYNCLNRLCSYDLAWQPLRLLGAATVEAGALQISSELFKQPLIAYTNGGEVLYYRLTDNTLHRQTGFHVGHGALLHPFYHAKEPDSQIRYTLLNEKELERLSLLIRYIFLKRGKITHIRNDHQDDVLLQFESLCQHMQQAVAANRGRKNNTPQSNAETKVTESTTSMNRSITTAGRETVIDDTTTDSEEEPPSKRIKLARTRSSHPEPKSTTSPLLDQAETQLQQLSSTLRQCRTEKQASLNLIKADADRKVKFAEAALEEERRRRVAAEELVKVSRERCQMVEKESNVWKGKFEELKRQVRGLVGEE